MQWHMPDPETDLKPDLLPLRFTTGKPVMQPNSKREQFYMEVGEAMAMNTAKSYINLQTLAVEINPEEILEYQKEGNWNQEGFDDEDKYLPIETIGSSESFRFMEAFAETLKDKNLQSRLIQSLEGKKPFANFKVVVENSPARQAWFDFRNNQHTSRAKEWIEDYAPDELKERIKQLPAVFVV